ncbi:MAG: peptidoglycan DD-metalloendopeptidase family protein [Candidatus Pacebacteria bacterium]|nr:peptidoglycan DD-metalloendopeptidase family protein [Candidatus Paceibacterota bacterium]
MTKKRAFSSKRFVLSGLIFTFFVTLAVFGTMPSQADAGIFSFMSNLFADNGAINQTLQTAAVSEAVIDASNTQKMPILQAAVNSDPNPSKEKADLNIVGGQALVSETGPVGSVADVQAEEVKQYSDRISVYVVHDGDTIKQIADMFNVSQNTILWANNLKSKSDIKTGMTLVILPISGVKYIVKKGDTLKSIAAAYKGNIDDISTYNNLEDNAQLAVGDEIIIPDGEVSEVSSSSSSSSSKTPVTTSPSISKKGFAPASDGTSHMTDPSGYFIRPIRGGVRTQGLHGHNGVDLASSYGASILAAASGQVIVARSGGWNGGYGTYVVISHDNGMQTLYGHLSSLNVTVGQHVSQGQVIGGMGATGEATGVHLHFEVRGGVNPF